MGSLERYPAFAHYLFGVMSLALAVTHPMIHEAGAPLDPEVLVPALLAVAIGYAGYRYSKLRPSTEQVTVTAAILCGGYLYGAGFVGYIGAVQYSNGTLSAIPLYLLLTAGFGGTALTTLITHFYVEYSRRLAELEAQTERAERLRKQVSVLNRTLRHNLRNELSIIRGWLDEVLEDEAAQAERRPTDGGLEGVPREHARRRVLEHLTELEELSETARRIQGVLSDREQTTVEVTNCIDAGVEQIRNEEPAVDIDDDGTTPVTVEAHPELDAAIREAFANAVEHNDTDDLTIEVSVDDSVTRETPGDWCRLDIVDTGGGIPDVEVEALEGSAESKLVHGLGLGLYLIQTVVEESGGDVEITNRGSEATVVRMWLPCAGDDPTA